MGNLDCLKDYIGIYGCNRPEPDSGLFVNQLGIPLESIDKLATPEQQNFLGVWDDVQTRATRRLLTAITAFFSQRYKLNSVLEIYYSGLRINAANVTPAGAQWRGFIYEINASADSPLQSTEINYLKLYSPVAGATITFLFYDIATHGAMGTQTIASTVIGWNQLKINRAIPSKKLFIAYYADIAGVELKLDDEQDATDCGCSVPCYETECCDGIITGATLDAATNSLADVDIDLIEKVNNTFGLAVVLSPQCDWANLVCVLKPIFANALWYALGEELMAERIYSPRLNKYTTIGKEEAKERRDEFKARYHEELQLAIDSINLDTSDCCIECNETVIKREVCP